MRSSPTCRAIAAIDKQPLGRLRLAALPDASANSLLGFIDADTAKSLTVATDGWAGYRGLAVKGYQHEAINLSSSWGDASLRLPPIHLVFRLAKRWLLGTYNGAARPKHLQRYLDESVFRFNRWTANAISHRFARLIQHAVKIPTTYRGITHGQTACASRIGILRHNSAFSSGAAYYGRMHQNLTAKV